MFKSFQSKNTQDSPIVSNYEWNNLSGWIDISYANKKQIFNSNTKYLCYQHAIYEQVSELTGQIIYYYNYVCDIPF